MLKHPIYLALATAACGYLLFANTRGYSPIAALPLRWGPTGPSFFHK